MLFCALLLDLFALMAFADSSASPATSMTIVAYNEQNYPPFLSTHLDGLTFEYALLHSHCIHNITVSPAAWGASTHMWWYRLRFGPMVHSINLPLLL